MTASTTSAAASGTDPDRAAVRAAAVRAAAAAPGVRSAGGRAVDDALRAAAGLLRECTADLLAANDLDVDAAERNGTARGLLDRLRLTPARLTEMATQLEVLAEHPSHRASAESGHWPPASGSSSAGCRSG